MAFNDLQYGIYTLGVLSSQVSNNTSRQLRITPILGTDKTKVRNLGGATRTVSFITYNIDEKDLAGKTQWLKNLQTWTQEGGQELRYEHRDGSFTIYSNAYLQGISSGLINQNMADATLTFLVDDFPNEE